MRFPALAAAVAVLILVSGCAPKPVEPLKPVTPVPERSQAPLFETPEEALAAAEAAYVEYNDMVNRILNEGGADPSRIAEFVTAEYLPQELKVFSQFSDEGWRGVGHALLASARLQQAFDTAENEAVVVIYACIDVSGTAIVDVDGNDVTPQRDERVLLEVEFQAIGPEPIQLLIARSELWRRGTEC